MLSRKTDRSLHWTSPPTIQSWPDRDLQARIPPSGEQIRQVWRLLSSAHAAPPGRPQLQWKIGNPLLNLLAYILKFYRMEKESQVFSCNECVKQFRSYYGLRIHRQVQHEGLRFHCDACPAQFSDPSSRSRHKKLVHDGLKYQCDICSHKANRRYLLAIHKKMVHE